MNVQRIITIALGLGLAIGAGVLVHAEDPTGHIYGVVETDGGREYKGLIRWGTEETFWDDHFNSTKDELPYLEDHAKDTRRRNRVKIFGVTVGYRWDEYSTARAFIARFGDIDRIEVGRGDRIVVTMKDASVFEMKGGSNDIGAKITVWDDALGDVKLEWDNINSVDFMATPTSIETPGFRLYGEVKTEETSFAGYIQWDIQENLSIDKLDGDTRDGDMSIAMGRIAVIAKDSRKGSRVELKDGRDFILTGSNDVDSSLRGINVEDPRYGRVKIPWSAFERVDFKAAPGTGRAYGEYQASGHLSGSVTDFDGARHTGRLVFDLDEQAGWEMLNGSDEEGNEFDIPFALIRSVEPLRDDEASVVLKNGQELVLSEGQDVSERNDGVMLLRDNDREKYIAWDEIKKIEFN